MIKNATLNSRVSEFQSLITHSEFTDSRQSIIAAEAAINRILKMLFNTLDTGGNVYIIGNGGSAAVASHIITDFCNVGKLRAMTLHEPAVITCFANDFGYDSVYSKRLSNMARSEDVLIAISSSGQSENIVNAVNCMKEVGASTITLSGFESSNPLRKLGDINYWVESDDYGFVEISHLFILHHWADRMGVDWQVTDSQMQAG